MTAAAAAAVAAKEIFVAASKWDFRGTAKEGKEYALPSSEASG